MPKVQVKGGKTIEFEEFPIKNENMRKINIVRDGVESEGVWAVFADADLNKYDNDRLQSKEYEAVVLLVNNPLHFLPLNGWGAYIPVKFKGNTRPIMDMADMEGNVVWCKERLEGDAKLKAEREAKEKVSAEPAKAKKANTNAATT